MSENNILKSDLAYTDSPQTVLDRLRRACKKIAPVWPLESFVAVNPYLGLTDKTFDNVAHDLAVAGGIQMTLPSSFYLKKIKEGKLTNQHIAAALEKKQQNIDANEFLRTLRDTNNQDADLAQFLTLADVASRVTNKDWSRFMTARVSNWAASYFDNGQAIWKAANGEKSPFNAWKEEAEIDLTPGIAGLKDFRKTVKSLPDQPLDAAQFALEKLGITEEAMDIYLHSLLLRVGGWAAYAARLDWDNELYGGKDGIMIEFLAILLSWEVALLECVRYKELKTVWRAANKIVSRGNIREGLNKQLAQKLILQEAFDLAAQQEIINKFHSKKSSKKGSKFQPKAQAIFCIDVRSEVLRRNLELVDNAVETLGFAGFFAFPIKYFPIAYETGTAQCPVLLKTGATILEEIPDQGEHQRAWNSRILNRQIQQVWKSFKSGAVTCFSFVSPVGLSYMPKLFTDSFGLTRPVPHPDRVGLKDKFSRMKGVSLTSKNHQNKMVGIPLEEQIEMAKNALNAMSLTDDFAKLVLIVGHGSSMVNNPHATGYDCGACGGHSGEANARVVAAVLNDRKVRAGLQKEDIFIPVKTVFLACLHDTTTDEVSIYNEHDIKPDQQEDLEELKKSLKLAGRAARTERSLRLTLNNSTNTEKSIIARSKDWSQTRPEWGLAGCSTFVVAPRDRSQGIDFGGRSFLHSYDWKNDDNFSVLELIMTAPMVVTSWISLQYYASTVDNKVYGSGNKTLHNVTAGLGVLEGYSGDLRVGLPWQAVHDGENYQHEPVKLNVIIEAPMEAMNIILEKHQSVRDLCDNGWLNLMAMDDNGIVSHRYTGDLNWEHIEQLAA